MTIELKSVIPLGRNMSEYVAMFGLTELDLHLKVLDCGGGPSSFNYELNKKGGNVISIDPIYQFSAKDIKKRIDDTFEDMMNKAQLNQDKFVWNHIECIEELRNIRMNAMKLFIDDYESGKLEGRYLFQKLPTLHFDDNSFDLALCSHFLFLYSDILMYEFHVEAITEMLRVSKEVRIFPLVDLNAEKSVFITGIIEYFLNKSYTVELKKVEYEFQKGANEYLKIKRR